MVFNAYHAFAEQYQDRDGTSVRDAWLLLSEAERKRYARIAANARSPKSARRSPVKRGGGRKAASPATTTTTTACSRLRKAECGADDACQWTVGKGCSAAAASKKYAIVTLAKKKPSQAEMFSGLIARLRSQARDLQREGDLDERDRDTLARANAAIAVLSPNVRSAEFSDRYDDIVRLLINIRVRQGERKFVADKHKVDVRRDLLSHLETKLVPTQRKNELRVAIDLLRLSPNDSAFERYAASIRSKIDEAAARTNLALYGSPTGPKNVDRNAAATALNDRFEQYRATNQQ